MTAFASLLLIVFDIVITANLSIVMSTDLAIKRVARENIINIISNYIFITNFGIIGAAYGTLTSYTLTFLAQQYVLYKMLDIKAYRAILYIPDFYRQGISLARNFLNKSKSKILDEIKLRTDDR